ncbi:MAG: ABC transporter permease [Lentisphaerae bacterium]|nr:ABC transporter permease [Lentisphaerota bacterium]
MNEPRTAFGRRVSAALDWRERSVFAALALLFLAVSAANPRFAALSNVLSILGDSAYIGIAAIGMTLCIIFGAFDLSIGALLALLSVASVTWAPHLQPVVGTAGFVIIVALAGAGCGLLNGALVAGLRIPAFIATLGMMYVYRGAAFMLSGGQDQRLDSAWFLSLANGDLAGVPVVFLVFVGLTVLGTLLLNRHPLGRRIQAVGNSPKAARAAGISVSRTTLAVFALVGVFTAIAGVLQASLLRGAQPGRGVEFELYVIATVVLGGTSLDGGKGSVINTAAAAVLLATLQCSFSFLAVNPYVQKIIVGGVLVAAFSMNYLRGQVEDWRKRRQQQRKEASV